MKEFFCTIDNISEIINNKVNCCCYILLSNKNLLKLAHTLCEYGFCNPYLSKKTINNKTIEISLVMVKMDKNDTFDVLSTQYHVNYTLEQFKNGESCSIYLKFSDKLLETLKHIPKSEKHEFTGELDIHKITIISGKLVHIIKLKEKSLKKGEGETVNVKTSRFNFHTHPKEAYINHDVTKGWPSMTDYLGYLALGNKTIFHCVSTIEGIYILSFTPFWSNNLKSIPKNFIKDNFNISKKLNISSEQYVEKINSIKYKDINIFEVKFMRWTDADNIFKVHYSKHGINCTTNNI